MNLRSLGHLVLILALALPMAASAAIHREGPHAAPAPGAPAGDPAPAQEDDKASKPRHAPLPPVENRETTFPSADAAVEKMYVTAAIDVPAELQGRLIAEPDFMKVEAQAIMDLIADKSVPNNEKNITYVRYTMGDPRIDAALIAAKKAGIAVQIVTDFNTTMAYSFKGDQKTTSNFTKATLKSPDKPGGQSLQRLMKVFKLGKDLTSQPLYNTAVVERTPIMHEKALLLRAGDKKIAYLGTANAAPHPRFNRIFKIIDPAIFDAYLEHVKSLVANYADGKETKEMPDETRKRFAYADGSTIELAFTNGRFNPNDRAAEVIQSKTMTGFILSEFAPTNRPVVLGIAEAMKEDPAIHGYMVTDDKFSTTFSYGVTNVLKNVNVYPPFAPLHGLGEDISRRIDAYIWQRPAVDEQQHQIFQTEEDGEPLDRDLWHDKTLVLKTNQELGQSKAVFLYSGSFNLSNNVVNAENQFEYRVSETSWLVRAVEHSIKETVKQYPQYAVPELTAVLRSSLAKTFKVGTLDIPLEKVQALQSAIKDRNIPEIMSQIGEISKSPTHMQDPLKPEEVARRMTALESFLEWEVTALPPYQNPDLTLKSMLNLSLVLSNPDLHIGARIGIIKSAIWRPGMTPEDQEKFLHIANEKLGLSPIPALPEDKVPLPPREARVNDEHQTSAKNAGEKSGRAPKKSAATEPAEKRIRPIAAAVSRSPRLYAPQLPDAAPTDVAFFDFDNTIMTLQTKIRIFQKGTANFLDVSSGEFAKINSLIGQPGTAYANYETRKPGPNSKDDSFMHFSGPNFAIDIAAALKTPADLWMAPAFKAFIDRLRDPATAARTYIVTARQHSPEDFEAGLEVIRAFVKARWGIDTVAIPKANWVGVGYASNVPQEKAKKILEIIRSFAGKVVSAFRFYDDDKKNTDAVSQATLAAKLKVDVLHVTGGPKPQAAPVVRTCSDLFARGA